MMKKNSKQSILLLSIGGILFICLVGVYLSRSILLRSIANKRTTHIEQTYGLHIHYENLEMCSLNEVSIQGLSVVPRAKGYSPYAANCQRQTDPLETTERKL